MRIRTNFPRVLATVLLGLVAALAASAESNGQRGMASWYGVPFHGRTTAGGETFDMHEMTAAHRTLPFGTVVEVRRVDTGRSVTVRINDRGPFVEGRIIDLSRAAAEQLGFLARGVAEVVVSVREPHAPPEFLTLQVASFGTRENAVRTQESLRRAGLRAIVEDAGSLTRVIIRAVAADRLEQTRQQLADLGFPDAFVRR